MIKAAKYLLVLSCLALLAGCGRRAPLDTPISVEQASPGTPEGEAAAHPPLDKNGKPIPPPTLPAPRPAAQSFPLDPLLN